MRRFPFDSIAWMSGAMLYVFLQLFGGIAALALIALLELFEAAPRLALLGILALVVSPVVVVASIHHGADKTMATVSKGSGRKVPGLLPDAEAWWAGVFAWLVMIGATVVTTVVMLVLSPPEPEGLAATFVHGLVTLHGKAQQVPIIRDVVWMAAASLLYAAERAARRAQDV
jgi:hypothetical protein